MYFLKLCESKTIPLKSAKQEASLSTLSRNSSLDSRSSDLTTRTNYSPQQRSKSRSSIHILKQASKLLIDERSEHFDKYLVNSASNQHDAYKLLNYYVNKTEHLSEMNFELKFIIAKLYEKLLCIYA
jgi:hypothetical protein